MQWTDEGVVLGTRRLGEGNVILELMTRDHGRHLGLVRGGAGTRLKPVLQPGNSVLATWRARLDDHLGHFTVEALDLRAASFLVSAQAVFGVTHLCALCRLLPERDAHPEVFADLTAIVSGLGDLRRTAMQVARFELGFLAELGFGLDLSSCAATGVEDDLVYVSPKSGRAVSREAGEAWRDRLLPLPLLLQASVDDCSVRDLEAAFTLTAYFLEHHVCRPRGLALPEARAHFIAAATRALSNAA
jgi:DNA repair protein RecO (recombination protein O)